MSNSAAKVLSFSQHLQKKNDRKPESKKRRPRWSELTEEERKGTMRVRRED